MVSRSKSFIKVCTLANVVFLLLFVYFRETGRNVNMEAFRSHESECKTTTAAAANDTEMAMQFHLNPEGFINVVADCIFNDGCGLLYHHVAKSGGTTVEGYFFKMFRPKPAGTGMTWGDMKRTTLFKSKFFDDNGAYVDAYCGQSKFFSLQDYGKEFPSVVKECLDRTNRTKFVVLSSYREPISRVLSLIHQLCNKHISIKLSEERRKQWDDACNRCDYQDPVVDENGKADRQLFDTIGRLTNELFENLISMSLSLKDGLGLEPGGRNSGKTIENLMIDIVDLNNFFDGLRDAIEVHPSNTDGSVEIPTFEVKNTESLSRCSLGMKSGLINRIQPAIAGYRNLTLTGAPQN